MSEGMHEQYPFRRVHRLTPLLKFWTLILALLAVLAVNINLEMFRTARGWLTQGSAVPIVSILLGLGAFLVFCGLLWLVSYLWWKATGYQLGEEEISHKQGVLNTRVRTARYDRIQAVDVVESVIARIFRVAAVRVETAGGGNSVIEIAYLPRATAESLRAEVVALAGSRAPGAVVSNTASDQDSEPTRVDDAGEVVVPEIPIGRSLAGAVTQGLSIAAVLFLIVVLTTPVSWAAVVPIAIGILPAVWGLIDRSWRFTARLDNEVLNVSYGLADRRRQSIPLHRIHAVTVQQPILWRIFGWWLVKVSIAGYGPDSNTRSGTTQLLPVGTRDQALALLHLVSPLDEATMGAAQPEGAIDPTFTSPKVARWVSPIDLRQQAVTVLDDVVVVHKGRLSRRVTVVHTSHIQELSLTEGPLQQAFGLCTVRFDLVPGPVSMAGEDLTSAHGRVLLDSLRRRSLPSFNPAR